LKLLTATEWAGVVFALSLIVCTVQGFELFEKLFQHQGNVQGNEKEDNMDSGEDDVSKSNNECENENMNENNPIDGVQNRTAINPYDILYILEMLLSFHAWYKCGGPYKGANEVERHKIHKALSKMLQTVKEKFHGIYVMVGNCRNFMIYFMFPEICSCLEVHRIGMQVWENTTLLILQNIQCEGHRNNIVHL